MQRKNEEEEERLNSRKEYLNFKMDEEMLRDKEYSSEKEKIMTSLLELEDELLTLKKQRTAFPMSLRSGSFLL